MTILVRNEGDKTGGAGKPDYCGVLSWDLFSPMACSVYVEIGDAFTGSKALPDQTCPGLSLGKKVFEVNRKITHLNDVFYWHWQCFDSLTIFFFSKFWRGETWWEFIHILFQKHSFLCLPTWYQEVKAVGFVPFKFMGLLLLFLI